MDEPTPGLIATKLLVPAGPRHYVRRLRLDRQLAAGVRHRLTLVAAPAGFGKTALVTSWLATSRQQRVGWLSLEPSENDPTRFWSYFCEALRRLGVVIPPVDEVADRSASDPPEVALTALINAIANLTVDCVLVLDDYHVVHDPRIHAGLAFLINQLPPQLRLVILTRADPPFITSRWRANDVMVEIRARDLSFDHNETDLFLSDSGVHLPTELQEALIGRLSGWVAALRLATNWIAGRDDATSAVAEFTASDSTIAAYLTSEVLDQLPERIRTFVLCTSILPQLSGPLCDAVMASGGSADILDHLYNHDLFLDALDVDRKWFRYHQLFAELLGHQLRREHPELEQQLHQRAATWYAANGFPDAAIDHSIAANDWDGVKFLLLREALAISTRSQPSVVGRWLAQVPGAVLNTPFFLLLQSFVSTHDGDLTKARDQVQRGLAGLSLAPDHDLPELGAMLHVMAGGVARLECNLEEARAESAAVMAELARLEPPPLLGQIATVAAENMVLGAAFWSGDEDGAEALTIEDTTSSDLVRMRINRFSLRAAALAERGQLRRARAVVTEVLELARSASLSGTFQTNPAHIAAGVIALQHLEHDRAHDELALVWERAWRQGDRAPAIVAGAMLARLSGVTGDAGGGLAQLDAAKSLWPGWEPPETIMAMLAEVEVRLCLAAGDLAAARAVLNRLLALPGTSPRRDMAIQLTTARVQVADGIDDAAPQFLAAAEVALRHDQLSRAIEALVEAAVASRLAGDLPAGEAMLGHALGLAEHEAIAAPFVWHAGVVRPMLLSIELGGAEVAMLGFRQRLLDAMGVPRPRPAGANPSDLAEPLSERELTVLRLLRGTLTNPQIAATLEISPNTLKTHLRHIYTKLDAGNRRAALDKAAALGLL